MIDVIIPAYNANKTINNTLMSLAFQRLSSILDIYIIDDCSDVKYEDQIKYFLDNNFFHSITLIRNEKNMGVGFCRKLGMEKSKKLSNNPWIFFLDSDDYMSTPYAFNQYLWLAHTYPNAKVIYSSIYQECEDLSKFPIESHYKKMVYCDELGNILYLHGRIYSRKAIEDIHLSFPTTRSNEDIAFNLVFFQMYNKPGDTVFDKTNLVCTNYNINSITRSANSTRGTPDNYHSCNEIHDSYIACKETFKIACEYLKSYGKLPNCTNLSNFIDKFLFDTYKIVGNLGQFRSAEEKELWHLIHAKYYNDIVMPLLKNTPVGYSFKMKWFNNSLKFGITKTEEEKEEIKFYIKNIKTAWNEDRFNELAPKYLTDRGYFE